MVLSARLFHRKPGTLSQSDITALTATEAVDEIAQGAISAEEFTAACLGRIAEVDREVHAFIHIDPEHALAQARALDRKKANGERIGPLHGIPVGYQGYFRHRRLSDRMRIANSCRAPPAGRCGRGSSVARGRRCHHRQNGDDRICLFPSRQDAQSARSCSGRPAVRRQARPRRSRPEWCRWQSDRRPMAR